MGDVLSIENKVFGVAANVVTTAGVIIENLSAIAEPEPEGKGNEKGKEMKETKDVDDKAAVRMALYEIAITKSFCSTGSQKHDLPQGTTPPLPTASDLRQLAIVYTLLQLIDNAMSWANLQKVYDKAGQVTGVHPGFYDSLSYVKACRTKMFSLMTSNSKLFSIVWASPSDEALSNPKIPTFSFNGALDDQFNGGTYDNTKWRTSDLYTKFVPDSDAVAKLFNLNSSSLRKVELKNDSMPFVKDAKIEITNTNLENDPNLPSKIEITNTRLENDSNLLTTK